MESLRSIFIRRTNSESDLWKEEKQAKVVRSEPLSEISDYLSCETKVKYDDDLYNYASITNQNNSYCFTSQDPKAYITTSNDKKYIYCYAEKK